MFANNLGLYNVVITKIKQKQYEPLHNKHYSLARVIVQ